MKKIAFINFHNLWPVHQETELEIMSNYENTDYELVKFHCDGKLRQCDLNMNSNFSTCISCRKKDLSGLVLIKKVVKLIHVYTEPYNETIPLFKNIDELKSFKYDEFDVGYAVLSSLISETRDPYLDVVLHFEQIKQKIIRSIELYRYFLHVFEKEKFIKIYIFNGRFAYERAALRAAEKSGLNYFTHERGSSKDKFMLFENSMPHDIGAFNNRLDLSWNDQSTCVEEKIRIGKEFYNERKNGVDQGWTAFTKKQNQNELPNYWDVTKKNIVIFLSSEDEFMAIGDQWNNTLFANQIEGLRFLLIKNKNKLSRDYVFTIRIHPNSHVLRQFVLDINEFSNDNVFVIAPLDTVSTYALMDNAWKIISFGSTMGIEASYWGKVSINLGNSFYKQLNVTHNPTSKDDIVKMLLFEDRDFSQNLNVIKYGYYLKTFGIEYKFYDSHDLFNGLFRSRDLNYYELTYLDNSWINRINYYSTTYLKFEFKEVLKNALKRTFYEKLKRRFVNVD